MRITDRSEKFVKFFLVQQGLDHTAIKRHLPSTGLVLHWRSTTAASNSLGKSLTIILCRAKSGARLISAVAASSIVLCSGCGAGCESSYVSTLECNYYRPMPCTWLSAIRTIALYVNQLCSSDVGYHLPEHTEKSEKAMVSEWRFCSRAKLRRLSLLSTK
jgi:hypothetical protein